MVTDRKTDNVPIASGPSSLLWGDVSAGSTSWQGGLELLGPLPKREVSHGQSPSLWSMKLRVMVCGVAAAPMGIVLFISRGSKET